MKIIKSKLMTVMTKKVLGGSQRTSKPFAKIAAVLRGREKNRKNGILIK